MQRYVKLWVFLEITMIFVRIVANIMSICNFFISLFVKKQMARKKIDECRPSSYLFRKPRSN